jgi:hypothetical protein
MQGQNISGTTPFGTQQQQPLGTGQGFTQGGMGQNMQTVLERVEKPVVVHEKILPSQRTEVQPVIHRDREQVEVHKVVQPLHERDIAPTQHQYMQLPAENYQSRAPDTEFQNQYRDVSSRIQPETITAPMTREQIQRPPIIEETIHKKIIEEVQPVLYRETFRPVVVEATKPIYERVFEAPRLVEETRPMVDLGTKTLQGQTGMPRSTEMQGQGMGGPTAYIHEKITVVTQEPQMGGQTSGFGQTSGLGQTTPERNVTGQNLAGQTARPLQQGQFTQPLVEQSLEGHHCSYFDKKVPLTTEGAKPSSTITPSETRTI